MIHYASRYYIFVSCSLVPDAGGDVACVRLFVRLCSAADCEQFAHSCTSSDGASHCVDIPLSGRLSGAACVCKSPYTADQRRQKCVLSTSFKQAVLHQ